MFLRVVGRLFISMENLWFGFKEINYLTVSVPVPHIIEISNLISGLVLPKRKSGAGSQITPDFNLVVANLGTGSGN
jgi:hypothetical protein